MKKERICSLIWIPLLNNSKENLFVEEKKYLKFFEETFPRFKRYNIKIKLPKRYIKQDELSIYNKITCEAARCSRMLITPDFKIYTCPLLLDSQRYIAFFKGGEFIYSKSYQVNSFFKNPVKGPICPLLMEENFENYRRKKILPVCVSFKLTNKKASLFQNQNNLLKTCG